MYGAALRNAAPQVTSQDRLMEAALFHLSMAHVHNLIANYLNLVRFVYKMITADGVKQVRHAWKEIDRSLLKASV